MSPGAPRLSFERVLNAIFHGPLVFSYTIESREVKRIRRHKKFHGMVSGAIIGEPCFFREKVPMRFETGALQKDVFRESSLPICAVC